MGCSAVALCDVRLDNVADKSNQIKSFFIVSQFQFMSTVLLKANILLKSRVVQIRWLHKEGKQLGDPKGTEVPLGRNPQAVV